MDFAENLEMTHIVSAGGMGVMLFVSLWPIAYENRYVTHPLHLNIFVTIEKNGASQLWLKQYHNWFLYNIFSKKGLDLPVTK